MLRNTEATYGLIHKLLHWGMGLAVIGLLAAGLYMTRQQFSPDILRLYGLHKSIGICILAFVAVRLLWRFTNPLPRLPEGIPTRDRVAAHGAHLLLYICMIGMPVSGWLMSSAAGFPVSVFGWFTLPDFIAPDPELRKLFNQVHELMGYGFIGLVALHAFAALYHHFIRKDNILKRMLWAGFLLVPTVALANVPNWSIVKDESMISFTATVNGAPSQGVFKAFDGEVIFEPEKLDQSYVRIVIELDQIDTVYPAVAENLANPDWFDVAQHPQAVYQAANFALNVDGSYTAKGELTLKGKVHPVDLTFSLDTFTETQAAITGRATLSRSTLNVGVGEWAGSTLVGDAVELVVKLTASR